MRLSPTTRCGFCKSARVVKAGWRYNSSGPKQRFLCKSCGRRFTVDDGFLRMKFRAETITAVIDLFLTSKSLRKSQKLARKALERISEVARLDMDVDPEVLEARQLIRGKSEAQSL